MLVGHVVPCTPLAAMATLFKLLAVTHGNSMAEFEKVLGINHVGPAWGLLSVCVKGGGGGKGEIYQR